jgi:hypothetical protein
VGILSRLGPVRAALLLVLALASACVPDLDTDESLVSTARVLAIRAEPAEARPGAAVRYSALLADGQGTLRDGLLAWFYCLAQKPLAELGPVARTCLSAGSDQLQEIGGAPSISASLPKDACALFGPNVPQPEPGEQPSRPVDPDATGGYKQPIMLGLSVGDGESLNLFEQRLTCDLPGVSAEISAAYRLRYHANENPSLDKVVVTRASGEQLSLRTGELLELDSGEAITLSARWPSCPESDTCGDGVCGPDETRVSCTEDCSTAVGCAGAERYLWFDGERRELSVRRESMRLSWYGTFGLYSEERTGVSEDDTHTRSDNTWTAPDGSGEGTLWVVLRDARGGVGSFELLVNVR